MELHTPTPWSLVVGGETITALHAYKDIATCDAPNATANAAFIVTACNSHDKLVEALKCAAKFVQSARQYFPKSIRDADRFSLEGTAAAINVALATVQP